MSDHARFKEHLSASHDAVWRVGRWMNARGYGVLIPPTKVRPTYEARMEYADDGDLFVKKDIAWHRVEVKRRGVPFTGRDDWPHPDFIVCAKHSWDNAKQKPYVYIVLSNDMKHAGMVMGDTHDQWTVSTKRDSRYDDYVQRFYICSLDVVRWVEL